MAELGTVTFYLALVAYSAAATLFFAHLARREQAVLTRWAPWLLGLAVLLHTTQVTIASFVTQTCPVESLQFGISLSAVMAGASYLLLRRRLNIDALGVAVAPLALMLLVGTQFVGSGSENNLPRTLLALHITSNVLGFALFLLAGFAGAFYVILERRLKAKRVLAVHAKLPALDALDRAEHRLLLAGFPLLTFGAVTGAMFMHDVTHMSSAAWVRAVLAYATWVLVALVLILRRVAGWRGRRSAYGTLASVACVVAVVLIYVLQAGTGA
jgi:ABC-type uncharacterized transport system permease subunit